MFDDQTAQRLDRLERGTSRRKWDSAVMIAVQRNQLEPLNSAAKDPVTSDRPLVDLLAERFDRLERKNERLEWQLNRLQSQSHVWKRPFFAILFVLLALISTVVYFLGDTRRSRAGAHPPTRQASLLESSPLSDFGDKESKASGPLVVP
jgi:hypothetical protein